MLSAISRSFANKKKVIVFFGPPGAGKGTQSEFIEKDFNLYHVSTGDALRAEIRGNTPLGQRVKGIIEAGKLVDDGTIMDVLGAALEKNKENDGYIFDGIPRTIGQVKLLDDLLEKRGTPITDVLYLSVNREELKKRIVGRLFHPGSGRTYHQVYSPPKVPMKDDITGEPLIVRKDDTEEVFNQRMDEYYNTFQPCIDYYKKAGVLKTFPVDGLSIEAVRKQLHDALTK